MPDTGRKYKLTFWAKAVGYETDVSLCVSTRKLFLMSGRSIVVDDSAWKEYTVVSDFKGVDLGQYPDSVRVVGVVLSFSPRYSRPGIEGTVAFDLVRLQYGE